MTLTNDDNLTLLTRILIVSIFLALGSVGFIRTIILLRAELGLQLSWKKEQTANQNQPTRLKSTKRTF